MDGVQGGRSDGEAGPAHGSRGRGARCATAAPVHLQQQQQSAVGSARMREGAVVVPAAVAGAPPPLLLLLLQLLLTWTVTGLAVRSTCARQEPRGGGVARVGPGWRLRISPPLSLQRTCHVEP